MKVKTILVVDDTDFSGRSTYRWIQHLLCKLVAHGPDCDAAAHLIIGDGRDALRLLDEQPKIAEGEILLLTDGNMPGMNGAELIDEMLERVGPRLIPVMMTGNAGDFEGAAKAIGFELFQRPVEPVELERRIRGFLDMPGPSS